jgi:hypothetical protein
VGQHPILRSTLPRIQAEGLTYTNVGQRPILRSTLPRIQAESLIQTNAGQRPIYEPPKSEFRLKA